MERSFRAAKEVVLLDPEGSFRRLDTRDGTEAWICDRGVQASQDALAEPSRLRDVFGRYVLLVHDAGRHTLTIRTDRYGSIPFFRCEARGRLYLARHLRALTASGAGSPRVHLAALADLLAFGRTLGTRTLLENVEAVESGLTTIDLDSGAERRERPWRPEALLGGDRVAFEDVEDLLVERFLEGIEACVGGAKQVALTLSGGMDTRCILAALLAGGHRVSAYHVSVPGSRAERYAGRIAELCGIPFHRCRIDAGFAPRYLELLAEMVRETEGMRLAPQVEMLWLRDEIPQEAVVLHGAFGELAKLRELRDYRVDDAMLAASRDELPRCLWKRYEAHYHNQLRILAPELRSRVRPRAQAELEERLAAVPGEFGTPDALQLLYLEEFFRSTRYGHQLWNDRVPTRFPFAQPAFLDELLRVRTEDRLVQKFQMRFLERLHPALFHVPDENTGTRANAAPGWQRLVGAAGRIKTLLRGGGIESGHGDLLTWLTSTKPSFEEIIESCSDDGVFDRAQLRSMGAALRSARSRSGLRGGLSSRAVREDALALQTFLILHLAQEGLGWATVAP
jgi:asparagine synthase (glutamine-hydrolysing)